MGEPNTPAVGSAAKAAGDPAAEDADTAAVDPSAANAAGDDMAGDDATDMGTAMPGTIEDLMRRVHDAWATLERTIAALPDHRLTRPGPDGGWSIKDHLDHLAAWERILLARLRGQPEREHEATGLDPEVYDAADLDEINQSIHHRQGQRTLAQSLDDFRATHLRLTAHLEGLKWKDLSDQERTGAPELPLLGTTVGNTYDHYAEHLATIQELADEKPPQQP